MVKKYCRGSHIFLNRLAFLKMLFVVVVFALIWRWAIARPKEQPPSLNSLTEKWFQSSPSGLGAKTNNCNSQKVFSFKSSPCFHTLCLADQLPAETVTILSSNPRQESKKERACVTPQRVNYSAQLCAALVKQTKGLKSENFEAATWKRLLVPRLTCL